MATLGWHSMKMLAKQVACGHTNKQNVLSRSFWLRVPSRQGFPSANKSGKQWCTVGSIEFTRIFSFLVYESNIRFNAYHSAPNVTLPSSLTLPAVGHQRRQTKRTTNQRASSHHMWSRVQNILKVMYAVYPWRRHGMANSGALWYALNRILLSYTRKLNFTNVHVIQHARHADL